MAVVEGPYSGSTVLSSSSAGQTYLAPTSATSRQPGCHQQTTRLSPARQRRPSRRLAHHRPMPQTLLLSTRSLTSPWRIFSRPFTTPSWRTSGHLFYHPVQHARPCHFYCTRRPRHQLPICVFVVTTPSRTLVCWPSPRLHSGVHRPRSCSAATHWPVRYVDLLASCSRGLHIHLCIIYSYVWKVWYSSAYA